MAVDGSICTPEEQRLPTTTLSCLSRLHTIGSTIIVIVGFLSLISVLYFFTRVFINWYRNSSREKPLVSVPMDVFMLSLFAANLVAAIGALFNAKWLHEGKLYPGSYCWAQGMFLAMSAMIIALNIILIALHTFATLFWRRAMHSLVIPRLSVIFIWVLTGLMTIGMSAANRNVKPSFFAPTPYWCFIRPPFINYQISAVYIWMWIALVIGLTTYITLFFYLLKHGGRSYRHRVARVMLIYPLVFCLTFLPLTVVRWIQFGHKASQGPLHLPPMATLTADALYHLGGVLDVLVFFWTRRGLLLFDARCTCVNETSTEISDSVGKMDFGFQMASPVAEKRNAVETCRGRSATVA